MKCAIVVDTYKLPVYERHLKQAGYEYVNAGLLTHQTAVLHVVTANHEALAEVLKAAEAEVKQKGTRQ